MKNTSETVKCEHTPTPWHVMADPAWAGKHPLHDARFITTSTDVYKFTHGPDEETGWRFEDPDATIICTMPDAHNQKSNAQFIVTACNAHDVLLDACQSAFDMLSSPKFKAWRDENCKSEENWAMVSAMNLREVELAEAISLATTT